jgi:hypothetical protein
MTRIHETIELLGNPSSPRATALLFLADCARFEFEEHMDTITGIQWRKTGSFINGDIPLIENDNPLDDDDRYIIGWCLNRYDELTIDELKNIIRSEAPWVGTPVGGVITMELNFYRENFNTKEY